MQLSEKSRNGVRYPASLGLCAGLNKSSAWVQRDGGWVGGWAEQPGSACTREELMLGVGYTTETSFYVERRSNL